MKWMLGEAARNLWSGTTHALRCALVLSAVLGALSVADVSAITSISQQATQYVDAGGSILVLNAPGQVDPALCDALASLPGVTAAGALRDRDSVISPALPEGPIDAFDVTQGMVSVLGASGDSETGVVVSDEVASSLSLSVGDPLVLSEGVTRVRGIYSWPQDGRSPGYGYAVMIPGAATGVFDQCWVRAWPMPVGLNVLIRMAVLPGAPTNSAASTVTVSGLNPTLAASFDGNGLFQDRVTRFGWVLSCVFGVLFGFAVVYSRRLEIAAAQHVGVSRTASHVQSLIEASVWVGGSLAVVAGVIAGVIAYSGDFSSAFVVAAAHIVVPGVLCTLLGTQIAVAVIREKNLFKYFKVR